MFKRFISLFYKSTIKAVDQTDEQVEEKVVESSPPSFIKGMIFINGEKYVFGIVDGTTNSVNIIHEYKIEKIEKHRRSGKSALQFSLSRDKHRKEYINQAAREVVKYFITESKNVDGFIIIGDSDWSHQLLQYLDKRTSNKVMKLYEAATVEYALEYVKEFSTENVKFISIGKNENYYTKYNTIVDKFARKSNYNHYIHQPKK